MYVVCCFEISYVSVFLSLTPIYGFCLLLYMLRVWTWSKEAVTENRVMRTVGSGTKRIHPASPLWKAFTHSWFDSWEKQCSHWWTFLLLHCLIMISLHNLTLFWHQTAKQWCVSLLITSKASFKLVFLGFCGSDRNTEGLLLSRHYGPQCRAMMIESMHA